MSCCLAKSHRLPFTPVEHRTDSPLQLIHSDVWQSSMFSHDGYKYYVSFIDDFLRFTWIYPMKHKFELYHLFTKFWVLVENLFNCKIKMFQSDGGWEFDNSFMLTFSKPMASIFVNLILILNNRMGLLNANIDIYWK